MNRAGESCQGERGKQEARPGTGRRGSAPGGGTNVRNIPQKVPKKCPKRFPKSVLESVQKVSQDQGVRPGTERRDSAPGGETNVRNVSQKVPKVPKTFPEKLCRRENIY